MTSYWALFEVVAPVFMVMGVGYAIRKAGWLTAEADTSFLRLLVNLLLPCFIFDSIFGNPALEKPELLLLAPLIGFLTVALGLLLARWVANGIGLTEKRDRRTFGFNVGLYNYSYIAVPLILAFFSRETLGVLFLHNLGVEIAIWTLGILILTGSGGGHAWWKKLLNAPVVTILLSVCANLLLSREATPEILLKPISMLGVTAIPLSLVLTGAIAADFLADRSVRTGWIPIVAACALRLLILPAIFLASAKWLPLPLLLKQILVIQAAMPCAVLPVAVAKLYGGSPALSVRVVMATNLIGIFLIPVWLKIGLPWIVG